MVSIGVDIGGTFTDVLAYDSAARQFAVAKVPTTHGEYPAGVVAGVRDTLAQLGREPSDVIRFVHGTTIATNAILERRGGRLGLLTTAGFEDILPIGRVRRTRMYDLQLDPEEPLFLVPRRRTRGIAERVDTTGTVLTPLDEDGVAAAARELVDDHGVSAIVVCFLNAYANPAHEERAGTVLAEAVPNVPISVSTRLSKRSGEYERLVLAAFDAYVRPIVEEHLDNLSSRLHALGVSASVEIMHSAGGLSGPVTTRERAIGTVLSGPAAGAVGALGVARANGRPRCIGFDMGGTSADVVLIANDAVGISPEGRIDRFPLRMPMVDIHTIGAGGGSIAYVDSGGVLQVGPESAGSVPGPACYGYGGLRPTVTDASVVLGYLSATTLGDGLTLDAELATRAVTDGVGTSLGMDPVRAAAGIHAIANANMANAVRLVSIDQGHDPRGLALIAFGGAGPVHAGMVARSLGIRTVLVPTVPGALSAYGLLSATVQHDATRSLGADTTTLDRLDPDRLRQILDELFDECANRLELDDFPRSAGDLERTAYLSLRYVGQAHELEVPVVTRPTRSDLDRAAKLFLDQHLAVYRYAKADTPVEVVAVRVVIRAARSASVPDLAIMRTQTSAGPQMQQCHFVVDGTVVAMPTPVHDRQDLGPGDRLTGPAVVVQADSTVVVYPGFEAVVGDDGTLALTDLAPTFAGLSVSSATEE